MDSEDEHGSEDGEATPDSGSDDETVFVTGYVFPEEENEEGGAEDNQELMTDGNSGIGGSVSHKETSINSANTEVDAEITADKEVIEGGRVPVKTELQSLDKFNALLSSVISSPCQTKSFEENNLVPSTLEGEADVEMDEEAGLGPPAIISIRKNIFEEEEEPEQVTSSESNPILPAPTQTPVVPRSNVSNNPLSAQPLTSGSGASTTEATKKVPAKYSNKKSVSSLGFKRLLRAKRNLINKKNSFGACNCEAMWKKERSVKNRLLSKIKDLTGAVLELTKRYTLLEDFVHVRHEEEFRTFAREHDQLVTLGFEERDPDITKRPETWREGGSNVVDLLTAAKYGEEFVDELGKKKAKNPKQSTAQFWTEKLANIGLPGPPDPNKSSKQNNNSDKDSTQSKNTSKDRSETREEENRKRPRLNDNKTSSPPLKKRNETETEGIIKPARRNLNEGSSNVNPFYQQQEYAFEQGFTTGPPGGGWCHGWDPSPSSFGDQFTLQNQMTMNPSIFPMQSTNNVQMGGIQGFPQGQESYQQQPVQFILQNQMIPEQFSMQSMMNSVQMGGGFQQGLYQEGNGGCWDNTIPLGADPSTGFYDTGPTSPPQEFYPDPSTDIGIKRKTRRSRGKKNNERSSTTQSTSSSIPETGAIVGKRPPLFPEMPDDLTEKQIATLRRIYKPNERFVGESRKQYRERILRKIGVKMSNKQKDVQIPNGKTFRQVYSDKSSSKGQSSSSGFKASASNVSKSNKPLASSASCPDLDGDEPSVGVQKLIRLPPNLPLSKLNIIDQGDSIGPLTRSAARNGANNTNTSLEGSDRNKDNDKDPDTPVVITL